MMTEPSSSSVFLSSDVTPSVTSWSSASMSFVNSADDDAGAVALVVAERKALEMPEEAVAESARTRSPVQPVKYVCAALAPRDKRGPLATNAPDDPARAP